MQTISHTLHRALAFKRILALILMGLVLSGFPLEKTLAASDPIEMLKGVTGQVLSALKSNRQSLKKNPNLLYNLIDNYIVPHADFVEMSKWIAGRNAWAQADAATQQAFVSELRVMVIRTYGQSLLSYDDQTIEFLPLRSPPGNKDRIQVSSYIRGGSHPIKMNYNLVRSGDSWKVYDIVIEGVSLVQGYRAQFADEIRQGGLAAAVSSIKQHNQGRSKRR